MIKQKLSSMPYAQAAVFKDFDGFTALVSYETTVITIDPNGWLRVHGLYSAITRKHIGAFMEKYAGTYYQTAKWLYNNDMEFNIHTGEIRNIY